MSYSVFGNDGLVLLRCGYFYVTYGFCGALASIGPYDRQSAWTGHAVGTSTGEPVRCVRDYSLFSIIHVYRERALFVLY